MAHGSLWIKREILRQDLILLKINKEKGKDDKRTIEQWLTETIEELDKVCKQSYYNPMLNISVRQRRLLKMWAVNFAIAFVCAIAVFALVLGACIGLIALGKTYGPGAILGTMIGTFAVTGIAIVSYHIAKEKLTNIEREEERTMMALKADFPAPRKSYTDLMDQLNVLTSKIDRKYRKK